MKFGCYCFAPEGHNNKHLLTSVEGRSWKRVIWADWKDVKPEWREYHGYIDIQTNEAYDNQVFDDKEAFYKCYYELFHELKEKHIIRSSLLRENGICLHSWLKEKDNA